MDPLSSRGGRAHNTTAQMCGFVWENIAVKIANTCSDSAWSVRRAIIHVLYKLQARDNNNHFYSHAPKMQQ